MRLLFVKQSLAWPRASGHDVHTYYMMKACAGLGHAVETPGHVTDLEVVADGYVAVTPLYLDLTHEAGLDRLAQRFGEGVQ